MRWIIKLGVPIYLDGAVSNLHLLEVVELEEQQLTTCNSGLNTVFQDAVLFFPRNIMNQVIQAVTFSSPNVGGHLAISKGSREITIPKKVTIS